MIADLGVAFLAGLLSCASACVLPLLPAFVAYLGGVSSSPVAGRPDLRVLGSASLFVAGFATAFVAMGTAAGLIGAEVADYRPALVATAGLLLVAFGVALLAGAPLLSREWRLHVAHRLPRTVPASYVLGLAFAAGWTPCVGPILAAILVQAATAATAARGAALLAAYSVGLGLPFLGTAAFVVPATAILKRIRGAYPVLNAAAAAFLIAMGVLTLTGHLTVLNGLAPQLPAAPQPAGLSGGAPAGGTVSRLVGRPVPAVSVSDVVGRRLNLRQLRGRPLVVTFWASWCVPCRQELPLFAASAQAHRAQGLEVVPVDYREAADSVERFWGVLGLGLTPYLDPDGEVAGQFGVGLQETGLPVTVLVDRQDSVRSVFLGQVDQTTFTAGLDRMLRE